jgi:aspartate/methionine/tyrosine aminotransferase
LSNFWKNANSGDVLGQDLASVHDRHVQGVCEKVAEAFERAHGVRVDAATQITICCGQSEAMAAAVFAGKEQTLCTLDVYDKVASSPLQFQYLFWESGCYFAFFVLAVVEEGDEVVLLDPVYETYQSCIILAGGTPVSAITWIVYKLLWILAMDVVTDCLHVVHH